MPRSLPNWGLVAALFAGLLVSTAWAQTTKDNHGSTRPPWDWTLEERLAARFDADKIQERRRTEVEKLRADGRLEEAERIAQSPPWYNPISGNDHPELLMPTRLFESLLSEAFYYDRRDRLNIQRSLALRSKGLKPDEEFWRDLSILAAELLAMKHQVRLIFDQFDATDDPDEEAILQQRLKEVQRGHCRLVWSTLQACREYFGREAFDRFLYEVAAPGTATGSIMPGKESAGMPLDQWLEHTRELTRRLATGECRDEN